MGKQAATGYSCSRVVLLTFDAELSFSEVASAAAAPAGNHVGIVGSFEKGGYRGALGEDDREKVGQCLCCNADV